MIIVIVDTNYIHYQKTIIETIEIYKNPGVSGKNYYAKIYIRDAPASGYIQIYDNPEKLLKDYPEIEWEKISEDYVVVEREIDGGKIIGVKYYPRGRKK